MLGDFALVAAVTVGVFLLAAHLELYESFSRWAAGYEFVQADEIPVALLALALGCCWIALRRALEARREVAERIRAEARIAELLAHNRDLSQRLILAQESERRALARELHDEVAQNCTALRIEASFLMHSPPGDGAGIAASARRIAQAAETLHALVRGMLHRLRPAALDSLGLESALQELCESWEEQSGIACGFFPRDIPPALDDSTCIALFRLVQEGLSNVARHAGAERVRIDLHPDGGRLKLAIEDDGQGLAQPEGPHAGFGLIGMQERVAGLRGTIRFLPAAGQGLRIEVELPLAEAAA